MICSALYALSLFFADEKSFRILRNLDLFTIDEYFMDKMLDNFLESLRTVNVMVRVIYRPTHLKYRKPLSDDATRFFSNLLGELTKRFFLKPVSSLLHIFSCPSLY